MIDFIWGAEGFPKTDLPEEVKRGVKNPLPALSNLRRVDRITIRMDQGFRSTVYHFLPTRGNHRLVLFHHGHADDLALDGGYETIRFLLQKGFAVLAFYMPLYGPNHDARMDNHNQLMQLPHAMRSPHPISIFLDPVAISLNYVRKYKYENISMIGISGGGWTTVLYSAIDPRIRLSISVAGSLPLYLRKQGAEEGDLEQNDEELYSIAGYPDLYILGSSGRKRGRIQILNKYDDCCFDGDRYVDYEPKIQSALHHLGRGSFRVYLDKSHREHAISPTALREVIGPALEGGRGARTVPGDESSSATGGG